MKKIILILFLFLLCIACYIIYHKTKSNKLYITSLGDSLATYQYINNNVKKYNVDFTDKDMHINDLLNILKYQYKKDTTSHVHQNLKKSDIVIISVGMNDIYYKLNNDTKEIYTFINNIINNYEEIFKEINKYDYKQVYVLGYYNITNQNNDLFNYANYKLKKIAKNYNYIYLDLNTYFYNNQQYLKKETNFYPNKEGFEQITNLIVEKLKKYDII